MTLAAKDELFANWLLETGATAAVVRPDRYVYGVAGTAPDSGPAYPQPGRRLVRRAAFVGRATRSMGGTRLAHHGPTDEASHMSRPYRGSRAMDIDLAASRPGTDRRLRSAARSDRARALFRRRAGLGPPQAALPVDRHHRRHDLAWTPGVGKQVADSSLESRQRHDLRPRRPARRRRLVGSARSGASRRTARSPPSRRATRARNSTVRTISSCAPTARCTGPIPPAAW